jgi:hypothetical protein
VSAGDEADVLRSVTREVLAELLPGLLEEALTAQPAGNGNGHHAVADEPSAAEPPQPAVPQVPAPPVAAVHRPSGWRPPPESDTTTRPPQAPAAPAAAEASGDATIERVDLRTDADLDAFVRSLVRRLENPRDRMAIRSGRLRFRLGAIGTGAGAAPAAGPAMRIERGAVTERTVREAAAAGARLVLAPRAVLTPMARDRARSLGVEIEKERPC